MSNTYKLYEITTIGPMDKMLDQCDALFGYIKKTAEMQNENIEFHRLKDDLLGGAPIVRLKCSEGFIESVKQLPNVQLVRDADTSFLTEAFNPVVGKVDKGAERSSKMKYAILRLKKANPFKR